MQTIKTADLPQAVRESIGLGRRSPFVETFAPAAPPPLRFTKRERMALARKRAAVLAKGLEAVHHEV